MKNNFIFSVSKNAGLSLVEMIVAIGMMSIVALGLGGIVYTVKRNEAQVRSQTELVSSVLFFKQALDRQSALGVSCENVLKIASAGTFNPAGNSPVRLILNDGTYQDGATVPGVRDLRVDRIYLADKVLISENATERTFVSTLFIEPSVQVNGIYLTLKKRSVATITTKVNSAGLITSCNSGITSSEARPNCDAIAGKIWNPITGKCQDDVNRTSNVFDVCPGGLQKIGSNCEIVANSCANGTVATSFDKGAVVSCAAPATGWQVVARPAPAAAAVVGEGAAAPPETSTAPLGALPVIASSTALAGGGVVSQSSNCRSSTATGETQYNNCTSDGNCTLPSSTMTPATRSACSTVNSMNYASPDLVANPPTASMPAASNSCVCGNYRIDPSLNQVCLSCRYEDSGWFDTGPRKYYYEGRSCAGGILSSPISYSTTTAPGGNANNCKRKVHRGVCSPGLTNCRQYYNDTDF